MLNNSNNDKTRLAKIFFNELFYVLTGAGLIFSCLEIFWPGIILAYINLNYILIFWLLSGIIILF